MKQIITGSFVLMLSVNVYAETCESISLEYSKYPKLVELDDLILLKDCVVSEIAKRSTTSLNSDKVAAANVGGGNTGTPGGGNGGGCGPSGACPEPGPDQPGVNPTPTPGCGPSGACPEPGPGEPSVGPVPSTGCGSSGACPEPGPETQITIEPRYPRSPWESSAPTWPNVRTPSYEPSWGGRYQVPSTPYGGYGAPSAPSGGGISAPSGVFGGF